MAFCIFLVGIGLERRTTAALMICELKPKANPSCTVQPQVLTGIKHIPPDVWRWPAAAHAQKDVKAVERVA